MTDSRDTISTERLKAAKKAIEDEWQKNSLDPWRHRSARFASAALVAAGVPELEARLAEAEAILRDVIDWSDWPHGDNPCDDEPPSIGDLADRARALLNEAAADAGSPS